MRFFNIIYLLLLAYTIAAMLFWGFSLNKQSKIIYEQELFHLRSQTDSISQPEIFAAQREKFEEKRERRRKQYLGEGSTFLVVILIGAAVVYSSFLRSIRLSRQQNNFMLSVTHELKSPIAAMKLNLQTLEKYQLDEEKKYTLIDKCIKEANRLNDLCNNMLLASQMEGRQYKATKEKLSFTELVEYVTKEYAQRYPDRFETAISNEENVLTGDRLMLQMAVSNLIENAIKYSPSSTGIIIKLSETSRHISLQVIDEGVGIPDNEKHKIFRKFYRLGNENTRTTKGTGLGLYLTQKIVRQHKGKISVKDNVPTGSIFELILPLA
ncbi:MAG TPA: HAMP domain-containing sensor histidine kinase [Flavipsychrobacter sp.]|nr:HAMP domain-containing sensor histidine kinase [Flavipsychrobacter sp.]